MCIVLSVFINALDLSVEIDGIETKKCKPVVLFKNLWSSIGPVKTAPELVQWLIPILLTLLRVSTRESEAHLGYVMSSKSACSTIQDFVLKNEPFENIVYLTR